MDSLWIRVVSQLGIYVTFALYLGWAMRRGAKESALFVSAVFYAVVFEHCNMLRYAHVRGGYHYHPASWLFVIGDVPLYIPLAWALILATSRSLTDRFGLRAWGRPFSDALLTLLIDLSLDVVAIRLGFWTWHGVGLNQGFFGVPADNFLGWLLVTFTFSLLTRFLWRGGERGTRTSSLKLAAQCLALPVLAYNLYLVIEAGVHVLYLVFRADTLEKQFYVLAGVLLLFAGAAFAARQQPPFASIEENDRGRAEQIIQHAPRQFFHLFGIIGLFCLPVAAQNPALWVLAFGAWSIEWSLTRPHRYFQRRADSGREIGASSLK